MEYWPLNSTKVVWPVTKDTLRRYVPNRISIEFNVLRYDVHNEQISSQ